MSNFIINKHHLIKKHQIYYLEKLISREIYNMQFILKEEKSAAQTDFYNPEWKDICVAINTKLLIFQYQLLHNIMYLNEMLHKSRYSNSADFQNLLIMLIAPSLDLLIVK